MPNFSIEVRQATQPDADRCERPEHVSIDDGAAAIFINGDLVAVTNEYGTALMVPGARPPREAVETFNEAAMTFYETGLA